MVSFISKGRYANFHFVACAAYAYALKHGLEFHVQDKSLAPNMWPLYLQHLKNEKWDERIEKVYINDDKHTYTELLFSESLRDKNIIIGTTGIHTGYFQSYRYFKGYENKIREAFNLEVKTVPHTCAVHFRGGDYYQYATKHPPITYEYLYAAITKVMMATGCQYFIFYTDDLEHCIPIVKQLTKNLPFLKLYISVSEDEVQDFQSMMSAAYNITANSSFSVLAAILNPNPNKFVVCPHEENYFGVDNKHLSVADLYPPEFIRIKY